MSPSRGVFDEVVHEGLAEAVTVELNEAEAEAPNEALTEAWPTVSAIDECCTARVSREFDLDGGPRESCICAVLCRRLASRTTHGRAFASSSTGRSTSKYSCSSFPYPSS